ncbi:hypothetical protein [Blastopirellula retiformator]|uniref:hypothetical protein n=1 Tax=Blastopirellula retiformator TaxID=2527970 RepID=UPI0011B498FE|nr:hypothetical protein [Blastopirellula retiformator]
MLVVILVVPRLAGEIAIDALGLWIGIAVLVAVSLMCAHFLAWLWQRTYGTGTWIQSWTIPGHMAMTKPALSWLALTAYFVAAPLAAILSLVVLFTSQTKVVKARNDVEVTTFVCLFVFAVSVGFFFWGLFRKREEKPHDVPLKAWKRQGRRIWISGIHRSIVEQLPPYAR